MSTATMITISSSAGLIATLLLAIFFWRKPKRLNITIYVTEWKELQAYCRDKSTWHLAITDADKLLDKALRRRKYRGKRMGERLVAAQRILTNNDSIWAAHNLSKKVVTDPSTKLSQQRVKSALIAYRQALADIGALPNGKAQNN